MNEKLKRFSCETVYTPQDFTVPTVNSSTKMAFHIVDFDQMTDSETSWLHSMSDYTMTCKSRDSVSRDVHKRVFAQQHDARKGTRMTRALRDKVEGMIDRDMQAEHAAYYIAACDPSQLLPAFASHREVLCEMNATRVV